MMIPQRLRFSGVRDYGSIEMNLGEASEHILITGPNGAGKSTLSFCMGAVLRSSKVDIEGLKSENLRDDDTWRATIHFLFKNEGVSKIDAPLYIEFRLSCEQLPKQPIKLQYEIYDGDEVEALTLRQTYKSGDENKNNFTAYRKELQYKYKVHPDLYYLIWYQQEVNQFSVMMPEERFRIFSEMYGIDQIQKEWETSLEIANDARKSFNEATTQQKSNEHDLAVVRNHKNRYEDNKRRLEEYGYSYALMTNELQKKTTKERLAVERYIEERRIDLEELADEEAAVNAKLEKALKKRIIISEDEKINNEKKGVTSVTLVDKEHELGKVESEIDLLQEELSDLQEAYDQLLYSESETKLRWASTKEEVVRLGENERAIKQKIERSEEELEDDRIQLSKTQAEIDQWQKQSKESIRLLGKYTSSYQLEKRLSELEESLQVDRATRDKKMVERHQLEEELSMLQRNKIESPRQQIAIRRLKQQQVQAYTLRHYVKVMEDRPIEQERLIDAIKYTIFYDAPTCQPCNDLYYVSLKRLIPTRAITSLPQYGLEMREGLSPKEKNDAARVLWWIEQFFLTEMPKLENGRLVDIRGSRGPQEQDAFILSRRALVKRQNELQVKLTNTHTQIEQLTKKIAADNEVYRLWNSDGHKVKEAEALLFKKVEQQYRLEQAEKMTKKLQTLLEMKREFEKEEKEVWKQKYIANNEIAAREADLLIYEQFGQQTEKINRLHHLEQESKAIKQDIVASRRALETIELQVDTLHDQARENRRAIERLEDETNLIQSTKQRLLNQIEEKEAELVSVIKIESNYAEELATLNLLIPELVENALAEKIEETSKFDLQHRQNQSKVEFQTARNEKDLDPFAVENYYTLKAEVQREKEDLHSAKNLLEENEERALQNEQRLETAIAMQVQKSNLLFGQYMAEFQFEGQIKYEKIRDKTGRPIFKLFIHVRKEGHRGKLVDVSLKARGGRVGQGVSGGEESLSSLLFALSLLQSLENQAGFIVLDEFDSALDDSRKAKVFKLYEEKLARKLIILSPKAHENEYYEQFSKAFIVSHDPVQLKSIVRGLTIKQEYAYR